MRLQWFHDANVLKLSHWMKVFFPIFSAEQLHSGAEESAASWAGPKERHTHGATAPSAGAKCEAQGSFAQRCKQKSERFQTSQVVSQDSPIQTKQHQITCCSKGKLTRQRHDSAPVTGHRLLWQILSLCQIILIPLSQTENIDLVLNPSSLMFPNVAD